MVLFQPQSAVKSVEVLSRHKITVEGVRYELTNLSFIVDEYPVRFPRLRRNGKLVKDLIPDDNWLRGKFMRWPFRGCLVAVRGDAASSYKTYFYRLDRKGVHGPMACLDSGMNGGPIYRDFDRDGRLEMVFDDYSYYENFPHGVSPAHYLVYKVDSRGEMRFWKKFPNPQRRRIRDRVGL